MAQVRSAPFLQPNAEHVKAAEWEQLQDGAWQHLRSVQSAWDYSTSLTIRRAFEVSEREIRHECQIGSHSGLGVTVCWHATGSNRRGALPVAVVENGTCTVSGTLPGEELGGHLHLTSQVVLTTSSGVTSRLAAQRPGSILWSDVVSVRLEGGGALFPVEIVDFAKAGISPASACWYLDWNPLDLSAATLGTLRLYINEGHEAVRNATANPNADATAVAIVSALRYDVLRQMIEGALDNEDFDTSTKYPDGTLGSSLRAAVQLAFGGDSAGAIRTVRQNARSEFETSIQAAAGLFSV